MNVQPFPGMERILLDFESQWAAGLTPDVCDFVPSRGHPEFGLILSELVRTEMEFLSEQAKIKPASEYLHCFPELTKDAKLKNAVVFEEYRLRRISGDPVEAKEIAEQYSVDTTEWPKVTIGSSEQTGFASSYHLKPSSQTFEAPKVGQQVFGFELVGRIGQGAFGSVFLARQDDLANRFVVLKFTQPVSDEHELLAKMQHTNIVPIYSVHQNEQFRAICMPFLGVSTLQDLLGHFEKHDGDRQSFASNTLIQTLNAAKEETIVETIPEQLKDAATKVQRRTDSSFSLSNDLSFVEFTCKTILGVAEGLAYSHYRGVVHGDLKPANILLDDDGNPIILDFHLAHSKTESKGNHIGGTLAYMAPEHMRALANSELPGPASDVYSAGVILFELLIGRLPHDLDSDFSGDLNTLASDREQRFEINTPDRKRLGPDLSSILEHCLEPNPAKRYQNGEQLAADLRALENNRVLEFAPDRNLINRARKWAKRHPRISSVSSVVLLSTLLLGLLGAMLWASLQNSANLEAINKSEALIDRSVALKYPLTAVTYHDRQHFSNAISDAKTAIDEFGWTAPASLSQQKRALRIPRELIESESNAAMELHFWIAEAYQRISTTTDAKETLTKALHHNRAAVEFVGTSQSSKGLALQRANIERLLLAYGGDVPELAPVPLARSTEIESWRGDRLMTAFANRADSTSAMDELNKLVEEDPNDFLAWFLLGQVCYQSKQYEKANACFSVCIALSPENSLPLIYRGMTKLSQSAADGAIEDLNRAAEFTPDDLAIIENLALAHIRKQEFESALRYLDQAISFGTRHTRVWHLRSRVKRRLGDAVGADADQNEFLQLKPEDELSWITRGNQKLRSDPEAALADYQEAIKHNPRSTTALNNIAHIYAEHLEDTETAIQYMDRVVKIDESNPKFFAARGVLYARLGKRGLAINDARVALDIDTSPDTAYRVAGIYAQTSSAIPDDANIAVSLLSQAAIGNPGLVRKMMRNDPDLIPLKDSELFVDVVETLEKLFQTLKLAVQKSR